MSRPQRVLIAILTYRRLEQLAGLLPELIDQIDTEGPVVRMLVVDNDPMGGASVVAESFAAAGVEYLHEPRPGIAAARNAALTAAAKFDALIFIDDDERPTRGWLSSMIAVYRGTDCAAVVGPVISEFGGKPDAFVGAGSFFSRRRLVTGTVVEVAATNNLMLDMVRVRAWGLSFDEAFGLSGGSDTLFTAELVNHGGKMIWCDEALVIDRVPADRLHKKWVMRRAFRSGNSRSRVDLHVASSPVNRLVVRLRRSAAGILRAAVGGVNLALGLMTRSMSRQARGARTLARGLGMATGAWGYVYEEYQRLGPTTIGTSPSEVCG